MNGLRVTELAEAAGVAASTVRFYERVGLLTPAKRAENGYRLFDPSAIDELAFISRAKGIGMSLEDIAELVAAWPDTECRLLQDQLRGFLDERIGQVRAQRDELAAFEAQLSAVRERLAGRHPGAERCGKGCGCEADLELTTEPVESPALSWTCSLDDEGLIERIDEWRTLAARATSIHHDADTVRLVLAAEPDLVAIAAALCLAETHCCATTSFAMEIGTDRVVLTVRAPSAPGLLDALFPTEVCR
jgi:DNA-binding transcriptional MerR regulator